MKTIRLWTVILVAMLVACSSAVVPEESDIASPEPTALPPQETAPPALTATTPPTTAPVAEPAEAGDETTETGGRRAEFPNTIVVYQRDSQKWTIYVTGRIVGGDGSEWMVPAEGVKPLFDSVEADAFWELEEVYDAAGDCPDCAVHKLIVYRGGEIKEITISQKLEALPKPLGIAVSAIEQVIVLQ